LDAFSGHLAADELYDGPFCVLSIVDNRTFGRLFYRVLEQDPTQEDIRAFFGEFKAQLDARGLKVRFLLRGFCAFCAHVVPHQAACWRRVAG
jgi:hypothetical protein